MARLLIAGLHALAGIGLVRAAGLLAVGAILAGVVLHRRSGPSLFPPWRTEPWLPITAGVAVLAVTNGGTLAAAHPSAPSGMLALAAYPLIAAGLLRMLSGRLPNRRADVLVEAGLVATLFGLALWALVAPGRLEFGLSMAVSVTTVALAALDLLLLTVAVHLLLLPGDRIFVYRATALAVGYLLGAHVTAAVGIFGGDQGPSGIVRGLLVAAFAFFALAALDPSMRRLFEPLTGEPPSFSPAHLVLTEMGLLAAPAVVALNAHRHLAIAAAPAIGATVLSVVVAVYLGTLLLQRSTIERRAEHDSLTGLPNRTLFGDRLSRALAHARRNDLPVAVLFVDLDRFKHVNDSLGHATGDELLRQVARRLRACVRDEDTVARLGGDEFALLLPHISGVDGAVVIARRLLDAFTVPVGLGEQEVVVSPSIGISLFPQDGDDAAALVEGADAAMYRAKDRGRNTFEIFSPTLRTEANARLALEASFRRALVEEELVLHYQPKVDLRTGRIAGAEALVRWNHPEQGLLYPGVFVPMAEQTGQVVALGEFVTAAACEQLQAWRQAELPEIQVAVNVSARQLRHGLAEYVARALRESGLDGRCLDLELTESAALESLELTVQELEELRGVGVTCSIDDFGTGYCGLSYLSRLPIDALKIDRSFITALDDGPDTIVAAIISLGHSLGLKVIAEGVETADQLAYLAQRGCDEMQGYLFSRPLPADAFAALVRAHDRDEATNVVPVGLPRSGTA
jgi:diguanylate cyclase (GGDEF)-like protein